MQEWQSKAKALGATRALLDVAADNLPAIALYNLCGYRPCGARKSYYLRENNQKIDAIVMDCPLV